MDRKLLPLALLHANDGEPIEGRTRLQKMVFLMQQRLQESDEAPDLPADDWAGSQQDPDPLYEFVPYDYGPFSKDLYADLDTLRSHDLVEQEVVDITNGTKYNYRIKEAGNDRVATEQDISTVDQVLDLAAEIKSDYNDMLLSDLIDEVYTRYPEYAENSIY